MRQKCRPRTIDKRRREGKREGGGRERGNPSGSELFSRCNCALCKCICICKCCWIHCLRLSLRLQAVVATLSREFRLPWVGDARPKRRSQATPDPSELVATNVSCSLYHFIFWADAAATGHEKQLSIAHKVRYFCVYFVVFFSCCFCICIFFRPHSTLDTRQNEVVSLSLTSRNSSSRMFMHARDALSCSVALHSSLSLSLFLSLQLPQASVL